MSTNPVYADVQKLEAGERVEVFELDMRAITGNPGDILRFHGYTQIGPVFWQAQEFSPWPIHAEGFERTTDQQPTPTIAVGNVDGSITALCLAWQDLVGARIVRHKTFGKYLDAENFPGVGNPTANPLAEFQPDVWFIERKASETNTTVSFELSNALNFMGQQLPGRQIVANVCTWQYRSTECGYTGPAVADINDKPTTDPAKDACGKRASSCKLRFPNQPLPFGGYPAADVSRT